MELMPDDRGPGRGGGLRALAHREIHVGPLIAALTGPRRLEALVALGVVLRVAQFLAGRSFWLDEGSLGDNILSLPLSGLFGPLTSTQIAPPGFLVVEWMVSRALGGSIDTFVYSLRLFPLLGGIASLFLFRDVARRQLEPGAAWIALALFAIDDDQIYFANELKPYGTDVTAALIVYRMVLPSASGPLTPARLLGLAAAGAALVWFSLPSAFVLGGVGGVLIASALTRRDWRRALLLVLVAVAWAASFVGVYAVSQAQLDHRRDMWVFWDFAFPPWPPATAWDASWPIRRGLLLFINPLGFETPLGPVVSALLPAALFLAGCVSMGRRRPETLALLLAPGLLALLASYPRLYPFHGRLVLFLAPALLLLIGEGADHVGRWLGDRARVVVLVALFLFPAWGACYQILVPRDRPTLNPYGDRRLPWKVDPYRFPFPSPDSPSGVRATIRTRP
jgi:hypothetical protein